MLELELLAQEAPFYIKVEIILSTRTEYTIRSILSVIAYSNKQKY